MEMIDFHSYWYICYFFMKQQNEQSKEQTSSISNQNFEDEAPEKNSSLISNLAEKAMSVAGPVIPTKSNGGIDLERYLSRFILFFFIRQKNAVGQTCIVKYGMFCNCLN